MDIIEKLFKKLGYFKVDDEYFIYFNNNNSIGYSTVIEFDLINKTFYKYTDDGYEIFIEDINMKELEIIYKCCLILGWI